MKIGDLLLLKGVINKKQLQAALSKQAEEAITYNRSVPLGRILIEEGHISIDEVADVLNEQSREVKKEVEKKEKPMPTEINEESKFTFDLKFLITMGTVIVSACATYFSITGQIGELSDKNSPNRLEHDIVVKEIDNIKSMGDLKIISYKMDEYSETFKDLKAFNTTLSPLAADLTYIKEELSKLKNKKIDMPEIDLSGIDDCKNKIDDLSAKISSFEDRLVKVEKSSKGRF